MTPEEIFQGVAATMGRASAAKNEILRLLEAELPGLVAYQNEREGIAIPVPKRYYQARESLDDIEVPAILVGLSIDLKAAAPRVNFSYLTVGIHVVGGVIGTRENLDDIWDLAQITALAMKQTQSGWCLPDRRRVWSQAVPVSVEQLPGKWDKYSGISCYYQIDQRAIDLWTPAMP